MFFASGLSPWPALLYAMVTSCVLTFVLTWLGLRFFSGFRSREQKAGEYRADATSPSGGSSRLPAVGGPALLLALTVALCMNAWHQHAAFAPPDSVPLWYVVGVPLLVVCWLNGALGWLDDLRKARGGAGLSERTRLVWLILTSGCWSGWYVAETLPGSPLWLRLIWWLITSFFLLWTTLSTAFSDGVDGLTSGISTIAAALFVVLGIASGDVAGGSWAAAVLGGAVGFLLWNLPSRWTRSGSARRRARAYLGDSGALVLGSALGTLAVWHRWELVWLVGGLAVLTEGTSVLVQTGVLVPIFRRYLHMDRFEHHVTLVPHTEFPLPFLATPFHHHLSLAGLGPWDIVRGLYVLGAVGALLGGIIATTHHMWLQVVAMTLAVVVALAVVGWSCAGRFLFLRWEPASRQWGRVALWRGFPFRLGAFACSWSAGVDGIAVSTKDRPKIAHLLGRTLGRYDAPAALGSCAWLIGERHVAVQRWRSLPPRSLILRIDIAVCVAQWSFETGELDGLIHSWQLALRPIYQAGRVEYLLTAVADAARALGYDNLADELAARSATRWHDEALV